MAKDKQQKKKERERRVAQKKLVDAAKKRALEKTAKEPQKPLAGRPNHVTAAAPKPAAVPTSEKNSFTQRRTGG